MSTTTPESPAPPRVRPAGRRVSGFARARHGAGDFIRRVYKKADQDQIFFMAGAISFNVLVAIVPLILAALGVAGFFLRARWVNDPARPLMEWLLGVLPSVTPEFMEDINDYLTGFIAQATGLFTIGTLVFAWVATRLVGTLRTVLREIFDIQQDRSIIAGKLFDLQMVFVAGALLTVNVAITVALELAANYGIAFLHIGQGQANFALDVLARAVAFFSLWFMFALIYRYLPKRRISWPTAVTSATFAAVTIELFKTLFTWYFATYANPSTYGSLATMAVLVLWIYYSAIAFILGGEVGQVAALQRIRRRQKERLS